MAGFLAYIIPVDSGAHPSHPIAPGGPYPDQGLPRPPTGGQPGYPSHPIYYPPYPDQGLPGSQPRPDNTLPGQPPYPSQGPGFPTHPIVIPPIQAPQPPLGMWGPNDPRPTPPIYIPIMPPAGEGGEVPTHPIYIPVYPSHPIVIPPGSSPEEVYEKLKSVLEGNLPTNPNPAPTPV